MWSRFLERFLNNKLGVVAAVFLLILFIVSCLAQKIVSKHSN